VYCALWVPETKFTNPNRLDMVEGVGAPTLRYDLVCKICKTSNGACISCHHCHANFHVGCAHNAGYTFGFDVTPVKATRRDAVPTVTINGETGTMTAAVLCKEHTPKTVVHKMNEEVEGRGMVALQLFARDFKQADLTLTGTARKANLVDQSTRAVPQLSTPHQANRRTSTVAGHTPTSTRGRPSNAGLSKHDEAVAQAAATKPKRVCAKCKIGVSPRWWKVEEETIRPEREASRDIDGAPSTNGPEPTGHIRSEHAPALNGSSERTLGEIVLPEQVRRSRSDTDISNSRSVSYLCQKCQWKKANGPEESPKSEKSQSVTPETHQLPVRSPPVQPHPGPVPPMSQPWIPGIVPPPQHQQPHPPLPMWHGGNPHPPGPPLHNGIGHPPPGPPHGPPIGPPPPFHTPYNPPLHQPNGYPPLSNPPLHHPLPPTALRGPYGHAPLHLNNVPMMVNGVHSPHVPYSSVPPNGHIPPRPSESPFSGPPPQLAQYSLHHGSPGPGPGPGPHNNRASTPQDTVMRDAPSVPPPPRANTGASASPSLRNLLH
jgi:hypothetical protein